MTAFSIPRTSKQFKQQISLSRQIKKMSAQECAAALTIQDAWREYQGSKDSCPICLQIIGEDSCKTKCGHRFCTGCLLKAVQRNSSCPMCRCELIKTDEVIEDHQEVDEIFSHERMMSMFDGDELDAAEEYARSVDQADFEENSVNQALFEQYNAGYDDARQFLEQDFQLRLREEIDIATQKAYDEWSCSRAIPGK